MTDPFAILGLERGDLLAAAGCLHRYRQPHMVALVARLSEAEHRAAQARASLARPETAAGEATGAPVTPAAPDAINPPPDPSAAVTGPHSPERTTQ